MPERKGIGFTDMKKKRIIWIELMRIAACLSVVLIHTASQHFRDIPIDTFTWKVSNFYHGFLRFTVPSFIMISGCLYLNKNRTWQLKKLWLRNILPVAAAYVFWQIFYSAYRIIMSGGLERGGVWVMKKMLVNISSAYFHLWYLPMLIGLMIITPLLWEFVNCKRGKQWEEYLLILFMIMKLLPYTITNLPLPWADHLEVLTSTVQPGLVTDLTGYYILGHYLYEYGLPKKLERIVYGLGLALILAAVWLCQWRSIALDRPVQVFYENYTICTFIWTAAVFLFFKNYLGKIEWSEKAGNIICYIGGTTFGVYLVHAFFRDVLHRMGFDSLIIGNTILSVPMVASVILILSFLAVVIIRRIPLLGKWIV